MTAVVATFRDFVIFHDFVVVGPISPDESQTAINFEDPQIAIVGKEVQGAGLGLLKNENFQYQALCKHSSTCSNSITIELAE